MESITPDENEKLIIPCRNEFVHNLIKKISGEIKAHISAILLRQQQTCLHGNPKNPDLKEDPEPGFEFLKNPNWLYGSMYALKTLTQAGRYGLSGLAVYEYLHGDVAQIQDLIYKLTLLWLLAKPAAGFLIDKTSQHREKWLASGLLMNGLGWLLLASDSIGLLPACAIINTGVTISDAIIDGLIRVKAGSETDLAKARAACSIGENAAPILGSLAVSLLFAAGLKPKDFFAITCILPLLTGAYVGAHSLMPKTSGISSKTPCEPKTDLDLSSPRLEDIKGGKNFALTSLFLLLWGAAPPPDTPIMKHLIANLHLSKSEVSISQMFLFSGWVGGSIAYKYLREKNMMSLDQIVKNAPVLGAFTTAMLLLLAYTTGSISEVSLIMTLHGLGYSIAFTSLFELASRVAPKRFATSTFALLMSAITLGRMFGEKITGSLSVLGWDFVPITALQALVLGSLTPLGILLSKELKKQESNDIQPANTQEKGTFSTIEQTAKDFTARIKNTLKNIFKK
ncbi:MFS transporter [Candidatus Peregrinibacteria bacterium]|nr:MFS transporter [Candidatus Peregrinibacteria bacterium]